MPNYQGENSNLLPAALATDLNPRHQYWYHKLLPLQLDWTSNTSRQKINLPANQKGYDKSETTDEKLSARRIQIYWVYFSVIIF